LKIYTRTGDSGQTGVIGSRVEKDDVRVEAIGTIDELNGFVGMAVSLLDPKRFSDLLGDLVHIQHELFDCGADLAVLKRGERSYKVTETMVERLEAWIDKYDAEMPDIAKFILPGGTKASSALHICRTVCRRAERRVVTLGRSQEINGNVRVYMNRLSDFFFTAARLANHREGVDDIVYERGAEVFTDPS
jgi:cob(I)alamin adenosyltransferase